MIWALISSLIVLCLEAKLTRHAGSKLLMISMDGFRWDYLNRDHLNLDEFHEFIAEGVRAKWMTNQFQTQTFPNHWTMVTGLHEESHGIIANKFLDPKTGKRFDYHNTSSWDEIPEFWGGEPIWATNQKAGRQSAVQFWVGSELKTQTPTYFEPFNEDKSFRDRVDTIVEQLQYQDVSMGLLYMEEPDATGHKFGPDSDEIDMKLEELNQVFGYLKKKLREADLYDSTNIIVTSDHGMATMSPDRLITLDRVEGFLDLVDMDRTYAYDCNVGLQPKSDEVKDELYRKLVDLQDPNLHVWLKEEIPAELYYSKNDRIQDIWLSSEVGYAITYDKDGWDSNNKFSNHGLLGMHGFDPNSSDMHPIFFARGPDFANKPDEQEPFSNVDLYPLCCHLLQLEPAPNNGSLSALHAYLVRPLDLILPIAMGILFSFFILLVIVYAIYQQFWKWKPLTLLQDQDLTNIQYRGLD